uniref:SH3GL interacting endocytic adaptor 1 n=1 Tax=Sinocyclocheilus grahami TaxID=75366 RepID=A0A672LMZ2_SINGR
MSRFSILSLQTSTHLHSVCEAELCVFEPYQIRQLTISPHTTGLKKRTRKPQKKTNGAPNGFYGEIDWDRYNSPEVDEEGYTPKEKSHFFSSSESEEEEDHRKKFKIKIRPLPAEANIAAPSVDELKASIGNIALSPSPLVSPANVTHASQSYDTVSCHFSYFNITWQLSLHTVVNSAPPSTVYHVLFYKLVVIEEPEVWGAPLPEQHLDSSLARPFPTGSKSLLVWHECHHPAIINPYVPKRQTSQRPSIADLDNLFGPEDSPKPGQDVEDKWVCFNDESPQRPPPLSVGEPAPPLPSSPPPPAEPAPPLPKSPPPSEEPNPPLPKSPTSERTVPPPLVLNQEDKKSPEETSSKEDPSENSASPKETGQGPCSTPPPPPPPTYRAVVTSPGPIPPAGTSGNESGSSSPARPSSPLATSSSPPPPPPPRPPSRPKLPPGKPSIGDVNRPFSPPVHSSSPPPLAPLARAESTSSISSTNSLSAATTPTVGKELSVSVSGVTPFPIIFSALPCCFVFMCVVKITGEMVLSFPAGITRHFANNPSPAVLTFSITNYSRLEHVLPNPQLLCCDTTQPNPNSKEFWVNMPNLMTHLKKVAEQKPQATYYNVDMLKYQVLPKGLQSTPLNLAVSWRCEPTSTDLRIDYKYNGGAMTTPVALNNVQFLIPVDGGVSKLQAVLPPAAWNAEQQRILWKIPDISQKSENGGVGSLLARFQLSEGPSKPTPVAVQFTSEGSTLSGCDIELVGLGYRFSLVKKRFAAGKYMTDN